MGGAGGGLGGALVDNGWSLLAFEFVEGRHADFTPGSPDLSAVSTSMVRLAGVPTPNTELKSMPYRLRAFVDEPADLSWFTGSSLLHTEWNPHNVLMTGGEAMFVDWGWASPGASWIDPALWVLWLIAHGHTPSQAERAAASHPAWECAPPAGLNALSRVQRRLWDPIAGDSEEDRVKAMRSAAHAWELHRNTPA